VYTSPPNRPERLYKRNREIVPEFSGTECLYLRYSAQHFQMDQLGPEAIRSQLQQSVNRGLFSEPEDVLFSETGEYNGLGVVEFNVQDIPQSVDQPAGPSFVFFVMHIPEETNYSHSEIWSDHTPRSGDFRRPSKTVSMKFRISLSRLIGRDRIRIKAVR
jgi:hypothetical protein